MEMCFYKVGGLLSGFGNQASALVGNLGLYILHLHKGQYGILLFLMHDSFFFSSLSNTELLAPVFWLKISSTGIT